VTTVRVLVVDDEPSARQAITELLRADSEVTVVGECRNGKEALERLRGGNIDLVFLDVLMPEMDGLSVIDQLDSDRPTVVFVTAYDRYTLRAFDVHAVDYLVKPFTDERFFAALAHAKTLIARGRTQEMTDNLAALLESSRARHGPPAHVRRIPVRREDRVFLIDAHDVDWIEADGDYAHLHSGKSEYLLRETMAHLASTLDPNRFARIHRSIIVNLDRVRELRQMFKGDYTVLLHDGTELKLSRHFKRSLERQLGRVL
jgi:two-component system, LytTR family, response regulator